MSSLFDMNAEMRNFMEMVESGEIPDEAIVDTLEVLDLTFNDKVDGLATYVKTLMSESDAIEKEEKVLAERKKAKRNRALGIKKYLMCAMEDIGKRKVETPRNLIQISGCKMSVSITNEAEFLQRYPMFTAEQEPILPKTDKKAVYDALKDGRELYGATLSGGKTLRIK